MSLWLHGRAALAAVAYANSSLLDPDNMTCVDIVNAYSGEERCNIVKEVGRSSPCKMQNTAAVYLLAVRSNVSSDVLSLFTCKHTQQLRHTSFQSR